jgi:hypothetical protein
MGGRWLPPSAGSSQTGSQLGPFGRTFGEPSPFPGMGGAYRTPTTVFVRAVWFSSFDRVFCR